MDLFAITAVVLGLTAFFAYVNDRFIGLPQTIGLMVLALGFSVVLGLLNLFGVLHDFDELKALVASLALDETLLKGVLCFMLFAGSINVDARILHAQREIILALAFGATLIAFLLIGLSIWGLFVLFGVSLPLIYALVFGALISPTDPIAALGILGKIGLPPRLEAIINGESLFNDGVGVVLFTIALAVAAGTAQPTFADAVVLFLKEVLGGLALGVLAAALMHVTLSRTAEFGTQVLITLAVVALAYLTAEHLGVSGPIALVVTGLIVGNYTLPRLADSQLVPLKTFWRAVDEVLNAMLFVVIGLHIAVIPLVTPGIPSAICAIIVCLLARWISIYLPLRGLTASGSVKADTLGLTNLLTWGGLRGGLAIAMALSLPAGPEKSIILHMTYGVVAFSIIVQGLTVGRLFSKEQLARLLRD